MAYKLTCSTCNDQVTIAPEIVTLIENHTDGTFGSNGGTLRGACGHAAHIVKKSDLQERGQTWNRYITAVIRIKTKQRTDSPYVFLVADDKSGKPYGVHFNYYKDTRPRHWT